MKIQHVVFGATFGALFAVHASAGSSSEFEDALRGAIDHCKTPEQTVFYKIEVVQSKPAGTPAT